MCRRAGEFAVVAEFGDGVGEADRGGFEAVAGAGRESVHGVDPKLNACSIWRACTVEVVSGIAGGRASLRRVCGYRPRREDHLVSGQGILPRRDPI